MNNETNPNPNIVRWVSLDATPAWRANMQLEIIIAWLNANVGSRWSEWDHCTEYGFVEIKDSELAMLFKLKFGC